MANEETTATETTVETSDATAVADAAPAADSTTAAPSADQTAQALVSNDIDAIDAPANEQAPAPAAPTPAPDSNEAPAPARSNAPQPELNDSLSPLAGMEEGERKEVEGGRSYEIIFIVRPGDSEAIEATTQRVRALIEGGQGAVDNVRVSEVRRLAYVIDKESEGIYVVANARFSKDLTGEIDRFFKLEESVLRHMTLRQ